MPKRFGFIDASEIFIETPKHPDDHKKTWSKYNYHDTFN